MSDTRSAELEELEDQRERAEQEALGRCPGPVDLWSTATDRRGFLRLGTGGLLSLLLAGWLDPLSAAAAPAAPRRAGASRCILLWMNGGPSHLDTFDPKPGAPSGGAFRAISTRARDVRICEHLPRLAEQTQHMAIVRGMTSREGNHQRAQYLMHTGYSPNPTVQHPSLGAWVGHEIGDQEADLPQFVSISGPSISAGFLGVQYGPFVVRDPARPPQDVAYAAGVDAARFDRRAGALDALEASFARETRDGRVAGRRAVYAKAVRLMRSPNLKAFRLEEEPQAVREAYGDTAFGRGCLMARRLVEAGVRFVEVVLDGWDTHQNNFERTAKLLGTVDPAMSSLLAELEARSLLDDTLVIWMGEFGRTPRINGNDGRDHYPQAWSAVLAGGGTRGGQAHGQTDEEGGKVVADPVQVPDLFATIATLLGIRPDRSFMTPAGRPIAITEKGTPIARLIA